MPLVLLNLLDKEYRRPTLRGKCGDTYPTRDHHGSILQSMHEPLIILTLCICHTSIFFSFFFVPFFVMSMFRWWEGYRIISPEQFHLFRYLLFSVQIIRLMTLLMTSALFHDHDTWFSIDIKDDKKIHTHTLERRSKKRRVQLMLVMYMFYKKV